MLHNIYCIIVIFNKYLFQISTVLLVTIFGLELLLLLFKIANYSN